MAKPSAHGTVERYEEGCRCYACLHARALEMGERRSSERVSELSRRAGKPTWVDIHNVGMRRI